MGYLDSMNLYGFEHDNPVCFRDPNGQFAICTALAIAWGVVKVAAIITAATAVATEVTTHAIDEDAGEFIGNFSPIHAGTEMAVGNQINSVAGIWDSDYRGAELTGSDYVWNSITIAAAFMPAVGKGVQATAWGARALKVARASRAGRIALNLTGVGSGASGQALSVSAKAAAARFGVGFGVGVGYGAVSGGYQAMVTGDPRMAWASMVGNGVSFGLAFSGLRVFQGYRGGALAGFLGGWANQATYYSLGGEVNATSIAIAVGGSTFSGMMAGGMAKGWMRGASPYSGRNAVMRNVMAMRGDFAATFLGWRNVGIGIEALGMGYAYGAK